MSSTNDIKINTRGRPKKYKPNDIENDSVIEKKGRGRPRKPSVDNTTLNIVNNSPSPNFIKLRDSGGGLINPLNGDLH